MGNIINTIIGNDTLFYGIIVFLIVGVVLLFMYLHHKKLVDLLEEEVEFTKIEDDSLEDSLETLAKVSNLDEHNQKIEEQIYNIDGKLAIEKILNDDVSVPKKEKENAQSMQITKTNIMEDKQNDNIEKIDNATNEPKSELELMLEKMQHDLDEQKDKDAVAIFEQEQEEKSIISYKELLMRKNELTNPDVLKDTRFENEPSILEDTSNSLTDNYTALVDNINDTISVDIAKTESEQHAKKFVTTDFISPVFGRRTAEFDYPKVPNFKDMVVKGEKSNTYDLETTLNLDPLTDQIKKDDAFLSALKEFRKNLE